MAWPLLQMGILEDDSRWLFQQLIIAVDYCHKLGIANRDIKVPLPTHPRAKSRCLGSRHRGRVTSAARLGADARDTQSVEGLRWHVLRVQVSVGPRSVASISLLTF